MAKKIKGWVTPPSPLSNRREFIEDLSIAHPSHIVEEATLIIDDGSGVEKWQPRPIGDSWECVSQSSSFGTLFTTLQEAQVVCKLLDRLSAFDPA